jgi:chitodextrinase
MKRLITILAFLGSTNFAYAATPTISNVTGTIATGQTLTITGSNMVQEDKTNWNQFFTTHTTAYGFEGSNPDTDGFTAGPTNGSYVTNVKLMGNKSFYCNVASPSGSADNVACYRAFSLAGSSLSNMWYRFYVRYNVGSAGWFNNYAKVLYIMNSTTPNNYLDITGTSNYSMPTNWYYVDSGSNSYGNFPSGTMMNNRWYLVESHFNQSTGQVEVYVDNTRIINTSMATSGKVPAYVLFGIPNAKSSPAGLNVATWWDGLTASTSRVYGSSTIEISNNATYGQGTVKYQEPVFLSDGSIQFNVDLSGLGSGPYYLWITNNQQQRNAAYNLISGGSGGSDTQAPTTPTSLTASAVSSTQINLSWAASTDNTAVTGYKIYRGGTYIATATVTSYSNTGLSASTSYTYTVSAIDAAGNESSQSTTASTTTHASVIADTTPPSTPAGLSANATSSSQINLSWAASTDNVGVTGYKIYRSGVYLATNTTSSYSDTGLSASTSYSYKVSAVDAAGNESSQSSSASATTQTESTGGSILFQEHFDDSSFAARNWYDEPNHGTIVSGGQSGNCLQWAWSQGATKPTNGDAMRLQFTPTDSLYVSFYVKFQSGWRGSQQTYHPHMFYILSNLDSAYSALANNYLDTYIEFVSDVGSPYTIRPQIALQDSLRVNSSLGTPPNNLSSTTENRSVTYCNTPLYSGTTGDCYNSGYWYSANEWKASTASISTNAWHHVEVYIKMNSISGSKGQPDGIMQEWVDGIKVIDHSNILYRTNQDATKKWAQFVLAPYMGDGAPITETMWIDELTVSTASPNSSSITAPNVSIKSVNPD